MESLTIQINEDDHPELFSMGLENAQNMAQIIFQKGYEMMYPGELQRTDVMQLELEKMAQLNQLVEGLTGVTSNSSLKGQFTEDMIGEYIDHKFPDMTYERTGKIAHHADGCLFYPSGCKALVEIKNYVSVVSTKEVDKFKRDMVETGIEFGLMVSLRTGFVGRKRMAYEQFEAGDKVFHMVFVPAIKEEFGKIEAGVILIERLFSFYQEHRVDRKLDWLQDRMVGYLQRIDQVLGRTGQVRGQFLEMERGIRDQMSSFYTGLREFEIDLKREISLIWEEAQTDFDRAGQDGGVMDQVLSELREDKFFPVLTRLFDVLKAGGVELDTEGTDWSLLINKEEVGQIKRLKTRIDVKLFNPPMTMGLDKNEKKNETSYRLLESWVELQ